MCMGINGERYRRKTKLVCVNINRNSTVSDGELMCRGINRERYRQKAKLVCVNINREQHRQ